MGSLRYFAIRYGDQVEFRCSTKRPIEIVSKLTRTIPSTRKTKKLDENGFFIGWETVSKPKKVVIKHSYFVGGKVLGIVSFNTYRANLYRYPHVPVLAPNSMVEVPKELKAVVLQRRRGTNYDW